ncbi:MULTISPECIES: RluA family pseudouridine synthase [Bacteroides]|jgi:tRNA pseudouridine32 synthase/23S rRNA pseudouridine746 synthase|uniref:RNA pseudouridine synthase n=2 Tax=Bacteroides ovatus TaxID=28116 RepID=A0A5M5C0E8_BACOV|nr:RluA family pseudouridine synthase [Bacteroides ovatus]RJU51569.1 RluA family pseudouridine synthase [Bacteroides sp. CF01-10NS]KAA3948475.1 RNA pseudouridine synthase [Bacteroides ovatus]MBT9933774.1 RNA pseudouridine synthase [Bacteroides ovatus]MCE8936032.1 RNA pseudouridine synthase [Bacteroides ovatus]MDC2418710.1 pseudouridine synthase [Bacteroides ovatus]
MIHFFKKSVSHLALPEKFTYPFHYTPHPLCVLAAEEVKKYIASRKEWQEELASGKMFGVLIVQTDNGITNNEENQIGYLAAFSGNLAGKNLHPYFVPPVYDLLQPEGFFKIEEEQISAINIRIRELENSGSYLNSKEKWKIETEQAKAVLNQAKAELKMAKEAREIRRQSSPELSEEEQASLIRESQYQKAEYKRLEKEWKKRLEELETEVRHFDIEIERLKTERKERSAALQRKLFEQFRMLNALGEVKDLYTIFEQTIQKVPPAGAGECALPKLLQYAYLHQLKPLAMAEFWWGDSPKNEIRHHGYYYPSCKGKCEPILQHMLQGLEVDENPLLNPVHEEEELEIVFEDEWLLVVNKPVGMLSVPGKAEDRDSVYHRLKKKYPEATGPMIVHRLDMATSGLLLVAKTKEVHQDLQAQFANRSIKKRYVAVLDGTIIKTEKETKPIAEKAILIAKETVSTKKTAKAERTGRTGRIELPLCLNPLDRPRQMVSRKHGKEAITEYQIISESEKNTSESENTFNESNRIDESERSINESRKYTRIIFYPLTGRTHQLRVHAAHPEGLGCPILGDELYGKKADRLYLHAEYIEFRHPIYGDILCIQKEADFHKKYD